MEKNLPEIVFGSSEKKISQRISRAVKSGRLKKLLPRIYTSNLSDFPEKIIKRNLYLILGKMFPKAILSHRTAIEGKPAEGNTIFLTYKYTKKVTLPGFTVRLMKGPEPISDDTPFLDSLYMSSLPRAFLENMQPARRRGSAAKSLPKSVIEHKLDKLCQIHGEDKLNQIRDRANKIATQLEMNNEFKKLNEIISAILRTSTIRNLSADSAKARAAGRPYDQDRLELFQQLFAELKQADLPVFNETMVTPDEIQYQAFFEAYFSNYIEGTEFEIQEARDIVFKNRIPEMRPEDAHDILGTYRIVSDPGEMKCIPKSPDNFLELIRSRHSTLLASRPDKSPGEFKEKPNQAGQTYFVMPELVYGTLIKSFEIYQSLDYGLARSLFMMFIITEIHPFVDGNGRIARVMMNAELANSGLSKIIIPTVYREDYLLALRALSRRRKAESFIRMMCRAQKFSSEINFSNYDSALRLLERCNAFKDHNAARLILPSRL